jgi:hypothetical protein
LLQYYFIFTKMGQKCSKCNNYSARPICMKCFIKRDGKKVDISSDTNCKAYCIRCRRIFRVRTHSTFEDVTERKTICRGCDSDSD